MRNSIVIFTGPTLSSAEGAGYLDALYLSPAKQGDIYSAIIKHKPDVNGLIDGNFENTPAPWHKEILYALSEGITVYGASSMGALRAAELKSFGMIGVGQIFEAYYAGGIEDDDEVTVSHGPKELGYPLLSDAMVNIRYNLLEALENSIISKILHQKLLTYFKDQFYKERSLYEGCKNFKEINFEYEGELNTLLKWFQSHKTNLKKQDAIELLKVIKDDKITVTSKQPNFTFINTLAWHRMKNLCAHK